MSETLRVEVLENERVVYTHAFSGAVELGRQSDSYEELYSHRQIQPDYWRAVIAKLDEDTLSRKHLKVETTGKGRVRVTNLSAKVPAYLSGGGELAAGAVSDLALPVQLQVGRKTVQIEIIADQTVLHSLSS
ncbi:MAG: hypothetical protein ACRD36_04040, partial [Candidatus Acidiferrum sp.]